jgi:hypothetical protein
VTKKRRPSADHCIPGGKGFRCLHCGEEQALAYPVSMSVWSGAANGFAKDHRACKPSEAGAARFRYTNPDEWRDSWDTGVSSLTIFSTFRNGLGMPDRPDVPQDPADFGRCYRLLKVAPPEWRANLGRVAVRFPEWRPFVASWSEVERLYEEELPTGDAPRCYALMRELVEAGRQVVGR